MDHEFAHVWGHILKEEKNVKWFYFAESRERWKKGFCGRLENIIPSREKMGFLGRGRGWRTFLHRRKGKPWAKMIERGRENYNHHHQCTACWLSWFRSWRSIWRQGFVCAGYVELVSFMLDLFYGSIRIVYIYGW